MTDALDTVIKGLTKAQRECLLATARFLDAAAGEDIGIAVDFEDGTSAEILADELVIALAHVFGLEMADCASPFGEAVRGRLASEVR